LLVGGFGEQMTSDTHGREVRRLTLNTADGEQTYFLKRCGQEPLTHHLRTLLMGRQPHAAPVRERLLLEIIRQEGFSVMEVVAWGEARSFGLPRSGFLLTREVTGQEVSTLFNDLNSAQKRNLMQAVGALVGRLHAAGLFQPVRLKDLFLTESSDLEQGRIDFVLIDRETGKPWKSGFSWRKCISSLARGLRRTWRNGYHVGTMSLRAFAFGYLDAVAKSHPTPTRKQIYRQTYDKIKQLDGK